MTPLPATLVDVLIPAYNVERTVQESVGSILAQTFRDIRVIVVDDGSTDATGALLQEMAAQDPRLVVFSRPNGGIVDALNFGLEHCSARFIARHDADDFADPHRFERQLAYLEANAGCVAVGAGVRIIDETGNLIAANVQFASPDLADPRYVPSREPYLIHPFLMVRRAAVEAVGGYRYVFHAEDTDLYWRLADQGTLFNMPDVLGAYRRHTGGVTSRSVTNGMVSALNSQLAGLSELRRRSHRPDIAFRKDSLARYNAAKSLSELVALGSEQLDEAERDYLRAAVAAKLLELMEYRLWHLAGADLSYIRRALSAKAPWLDAENRAEIDRSLVMTAARLLSRRQAADALSLLPPRLYAPFSHHLLKIAGNKARRRVGPPRTALSQR